MKHYVNSKYDIVEDDELLDNTSGTGVISGVLFILAIALMVGCIFYATYSAKAEAKAYRDNLQTELCNLMEFNGSTYKCGGNNEF
jgi:hypothetical protein